MKILITAGNTSAPIDRVRCVTNIFSGKTGAKIASTAWNRGHNVVVLTSTPELIEKEPQESPSENRLNVYPYSTFDEFTNLLHQHVRSGIYDVIIHSAAVSDFLVAGTYSLSPGTYFNARSSVWEAAESNPTMEEQKAGKIKSTEPELWIRMVRAPKLVDKIRPQWGFQGLLVKFKLEVGLSDSDLLHLSENARLHSGADLIVANTLESMHHWAYIGPIDGRYERVVRRELADRLLLALEHLRRSGDRG